MDLTVLTIEVHKIEARKVLWELIAQYRTWIKEWKKLLFTEVTCQMNFSLFIDMVTVYILQEINYLYQQILILYSPSM